MEWGPLTGLAGDDKGNGQRSRGGGSGEVERFFFRFWHDLDVGGGWGWLWGIGFGHSGDPIPPHIICILHTILRVTADPYTPTYYIHIIYYT